MLVERISPISGTKNTMELSITPEQVAEWNNGSERSIQQVFSNLSDSEREFILTGITKEEWDAMSAEEELNASEEQSQDYFDRHVAGDR